VGNVKPVIAVAALTAAIVGEGLLRSKMHQYDDDYAGLRDLIDSMAAQMPGRRRAQTLRPLPRLLTRSYRASSSWSLGSGISSLEEQLEE
jgi:hypothetical protein